MHNIKLDSINDAQVTLKYCILPGSILVTDFCLLLEGLLEAVQMA